MSVTNASAAHSLKNLLNNDGTSKCFNVFKTELCLSIAPLYLNNPINGIKFQHLDLMVMSYFPKAQGVILSYQNLTLRRENKSTNSAGESVTLARIEGSSPFMFMWVLVDFLVWCPRIGNIMEGHIYMQTASHLGLLVHDTFNASIRRNSVPSNWKFVPSQEDELCDDQSQQIKSLGFWVDGDGNRVEGKLEFKIKFIHLANKVILLEGTLILPGLEMDSQPVLRKRSRLTLADNVPVFGIYKSFNEEIEATAPLNTRVQEANEGGELLTYEEDSDEDEDNENSDGGVLD